VTGSDEDVDSRSPEGIGDGGRAAWLRAHHGRWSSPPLLIDGIVRDAGFTPVRAERLLAGQANEVYAVATAAHGELILRLSHRPDRTFLSEAGVIEAVRRSGVLAPEVVGVGRIEDEDGPSAYILERRLSGVMLRNLMLSDPGTAATHLEQVGEILAVVHDIAVTGFGNLAPGLDAPHATCSSWFVDGFVATILPDALGAVTDDPATTTDVHRAAHIITTHRPMLDAAAPRLAHGDISPTNILIDAGRVSGVVDWEGAKGAPQANDFAWWTSATTSLATGPTAEPLLAGYLRVCTLDDNFPTVFRLCQLRILCGLIGYAAGVADDSTRARACRQLRQCLDQAGLG
jgi:aminoglycoside phosphotransferase (APT) family kinase protein